MCKYKFGLILFIIISISCVSRSAQISQRLYRIDTIVEVIMVERGGVQTENVLSSLDSLLTYWENHFSQTSPGSEILPINMRSGDTVAVSTQLAEMVAAALSYGDTLQGMFDITIFPLKELWGFGERSSDLYIPSPQEIDSVLERVGFSRVRAINDSILIFSDSTVTIDIGGIAKGFVLRDMAQLLDSRGIENYLVTAGGDIVSRGSRVDGNPWRVGIQHPRDPADRFAVIPLKGGSVVTSGDYERFYIKDSIRYHHIFDPRTGHPCRANQSLTIKTDNPIVADVLSTGLFCLPSDSILAFVEKRPHIQCLGVDCSGSIFVSEGWCEELILTGDNAGCQ